MRQEQEKAKKITAALDAGVLSLEKRTADRLSSARYKAVAAMPTHVTRLEPVYVGVTKFFDFHFHGQSAWFSITGIVGVLLIAFVLVQSPQSTEPVGADASLLGSELPPEAYLDKGFDTWLEQSSRH